MRNNLQVLAIVFIIALQFSCNKRPNLIPEVRDIDYSNKGVEIEGKLVTEIIGAEGIIQIDSFLMVVTVNPDAQLLVLNTNTLDTLGEFCMKGTARNEFKKVYSATYQAYRRDDHIFVPLYDDPYLMKEVDITESIKQNKTVISNTAFPITIGKGTAVILNEDLNQRFEYLRNKYHPEEEMKQPPIVYSVIMPNKKDKEIKILRRKVYVEEDRKREMPYGGTIKKHPTKNIIVNMFRGLDYLVFFDLENNKTFAVHQTGSATFDDEPYVDTGEYYFTGTAHGTEDYVILGYNHGEEAMNEPDRHKRKTEIIIFDWGGNFITNIKLDRRVGHIVYDELQKKLFALTFREEIYEYDLSGLLP